MFATPPVYRVPKVVPTNPINPTEVVQLDQLDAEPVDANYSRLYTCKHFRNRVIRLQQMCIESSIDAILIITGKF